MTNDKDSAVLAPCPFCGGEAEVEQQGTNLQSHIIACTNCGCSLETWETWNAGSLWNKRQPTQSDDEAYDLGKRDGYEKAVQDIDMLTGGDGEYCYSTIEGERHCPNVDTMKARIARRLRQPTQSDAMLEGDTQTILYLLGVRHGREDERAKIAAEASQPTQSDVLREAVIEECANALEADAMKCDCAALEERECGCGAWCEWKSITSARAVEIVRELKNVPPPEGDGDQ